MATRMPTESTGHRLSARWIVLLVAIGIAVAIVLIVMTTGGGGGTPGY